MPHIVYIFCPVKFSMLNIFNPTILCTKSLLSHRDLILGLTKREILGRYRGSYFGVLWTLIQPMLLLAVYTFVFGYIFKSRWPNVNEPAVELPLVLFCGLMVFNVFSECFNKATGLITSNINYVKKVVFPLEVLPVVTVLASVFHMLISLLVFFLFYLTLIGIPPVTSLLFPFVLFPFILFCHGVTNFISATGVFFRDISQMTGMVTTVLMFITPVFYPASAFPERFNFIMKLNPFGVIIEMSRDVLLWNNGINIGSYLVLCVTCIVVYILGNYWFYLTRKGFADVL